MREKVKIKITGTLETEVDSEWWPEEKIESREDLIRVLKNDLNNDFESMIYYIHESEVHAEVE